MLFDVVFERQQKSPVLCKQGWAFFMVASIDNYLILVETAGFEPASVSTPLLALHA